MSNLKKYRVKALSCFGLNNREFVSKQIVTEANFPPNTCDDLVNQGFLEGPLEEEGQEDKGQGSDPGTAAADIKRQENWARAQISTDLDWLKETLEATGDGEEDAALKALLEQRIEELSEPTTETLDLSLNVAKMEEAVNGCDDVAVLEATLAAERATEKPRKGVTEAIDKRIAELNEA